MPCHPDRRPSGDVRGMLDSVVVERERGEGRMTDRNHLTKVQYQEILQEMREIVGRSGWVGQGEDSDTVGDKYTTTNGGLCADHLYCNDPSRALFPQAFPTRRALKYQENNQVCPFDKRILGKAPPVSHGCFYHCRIFQESALLKSDEAVALVDLTLNKVSGKRGKKND